MAKVEGFWHTAVMERRGLVRGDGRKVVRVAGLWLCLSAGWGMPGWGVARAQKAGAQEAAAQEAVAQKGVQRSVMQEAEGKGASTFTLHAYTNLVQIPVLVLSSGMSRVKLIAPERFSISLDDGPLFRATHVRVEGDDPISLAIFLDTGEAQDGLLPKIDEAIAGLGLGSLIEGDQVSIYAMNCSKVRSVKHVLPESARLKLAVKDALQVGGESGDRHRRKCEGAAELPHLRSALVYAMHALGQEDGRRVMLVVTDGRDGGSKLLWETVTDFADNAGVAIFGMSDAPAAANSAPLWGSEEEESFRLMCERTGGRLMQVNSRNVGGQMKQFVAEVRGRYIVEFPRPRDSTAGKHTMMVRVDNSRYFIRAAGTSMPIPDPATLADPTTVPSDPTRAPSMGTKRTADAPR